MLKKIYDGNEHWYPGINLWWEAWEVDRKRKIFTFAKPKYSRLVNFARVMGNDKNTMINRHKIHMQNDFLMKNSFVFEKITGFSKMSLDRPKYCDYTNPIYKSQPLILTKIKPSLSSLCNIPIIYDYSFLWY